MNTYCLSCKKYMKNIDSKVIKTKNNRKMMLSRCSICNNKKSTFLSEGSGLFDSLGLMVYGMLLIDKIMCTYKI